MARTDSKLLADLLAKLKITPQALSQQRQRLQRLVAMNTDIATYVIAHRNGMRIDKYLDAETIERVNDADQRLREKEGGAPTVTRAATKRGAARAPVVKEISFDKFKVPKGALSERHMTDSMKMAGGAYPVLYVFENSVREFIDGHLTHAYGKDWLNDSKIVSKPVRETVERNRQAEANARYHSQRNARPIYYTNLDELSKIVQSEKGNKVFKDLFPRPTWFPELVGRFEVSRNIVAHMNPLKKADVQRLEDGLTEWLDQVKGNLPPKV
jgi:HEPN superfamily Swt1-like protein